jgi:hypothetical protein
VQAVENFKGDTHFNGWNCFGWEFRAADWEGKEADQGVGSAGAEGLYSDEHGRLHVGMTGH